MRSLLTALCLALSVAGSANAQMLDLAGATGSERLLNFTAKQEAEQSAALPALQAFVESSARLGFNALDREKGITGLRRTSVTLSPTLNFDGNANGGNNAETLVLGGSVLRFDADSVAQGAVMAGAVIGAGTRLFYSRGRFVDLRASVGRSFGLGESLVQDESRLSVCSRNHLSGWRFLDLCASNTYKKKPLSTSDQSRIELGGIQLVSIAGRPTELRAKAFRQDSTGPWHSGYGAEVLTVLSAKLAVELSAEVELSSVDKPFEGYDVAATIHTKFADRPVSIGFSQSELSNARILGKRHDDTRRSITLLTPVNRRFSLNLSYSQTDSPIEYFTTEQVGLAITFSGNLLDRWMK